MMSKLVIAACRREGLAAETFQEAWRERRGPELGSLPGVQRYVQNLCLLQGYHHGPLVVDAIDELWFDSDDARSRAMASANLREASAELVEATTVIVLPVDVHVIKDGMIHMGGVKSFELVYAKSGMKLDAFRGYWRDVHGPLAAHIASFTRYEQNHAADQAYAEGTASLDGLAVTWFASTAAMREGVDTPAYRATRADEANFLRDGHLPFVITKEHIVFG